MDNDDSNVSDQHRDRTPGQREGSGGGQVKETVQTSGPGSQNREKCFLSRFIYGRPGFPLRSSDSEVVGTDRTLRSSSITKTGEGRSEITFVRDRSRGCHSRCRRFFRELKCTRYS